MIPCSKIQCSKIQCSICLEPINENDSITTLSCAHTYHYNCLLKWNLQSDNINHQSCPSCRTDIGVASDIANFRERGSRLNRRSAFANVDGIIPESAEDDNVFEDTDDEMPELEPIDIEEEINNIENSIYNFPNTLTNDLVLSPPPSLPTTIDQGIVSICRDCNSRLTNCSLCSRLVCNCSYSLDLDSTVWSTRLYHSPHSPFGKLPNDSDIENFSQEVLDGLVIRDNSHGGGGGGEVTPNNGCFCSKCFESRDNHVLNILELPSVLYLSQRLESEQVKNLYSIFYVDTSEIINSDIYERYPTFTWNEFKTYITDKFEQRLSIILDRPIIDESHLYRNIITNPRRDRDYYNYYSYDSNTRLENIIIGILNSRRNSLSDFEEPNHIELS